MRIAYKGALQRCETVRATKACCGGINETYKQNAIDLDAATHGILRRQAQALLLDRVFNHCLVALVPALSMRPSSIVVKDMDRAAVSL